MKIFLIFKILFALNLKINSDNTFRYPDYKNHECIRDCSKNPDAMVCEYNWTLETYSTLSRACYNCPNNYTDCLREQCIPADGILKTIDTVNRQLPGPYIQVCKGDTVIVNVHNKLRSQRVVSIHWHGLKQKRTQNMDGVGMVTQWPIIPYTSFQYKFYANDPGTHVWYSHSGVQRSEMFGAFIVRDKDDPNAKLYDFDLKEHYMTLIEWNLYPLQNIYGSYLHSAQFGTEHAILINGKGSFPTKPDVNVPLETFYVSKGFRYRFRVINNAIENCNMRVSIDGHNITIISTDGQPIEPIEVESLALVAGERFDVILNAQNEIADYLIRVRAEGLCAYRKMSQKAILRYHGSDNSLNSTVPLSYDNAGRNGKEFDSLFDPEKIENFVSIPNLKFPKNLTNPRIFHKPNRTLYLNFDVKPVDDPEFHQPDLVSFNSSVNTWSASLIDGIKFEMPSKPALLHWDEITNLCNNNKKPCPPNSDFCICTHYLEFRLNELIELVLIDGNSFFENHPIHLHGHSFAVLGIGKLRNKTRSYLSSDEVARLDQEGKLPRNLVDPVIKDTVMMPNGGYTIVRFVADNPGVWLLHCHLASHIDTGINIIIKVRDEYEKISLKDLFFKWIKVLLENLF